MLVPRAAVCRSDAEKEFKSSVFGRTDKSPNIWDRSRSVNSPGKTKQQIPQEVWHSFPAVGTVLLLLHAVVLLP